jgi:hypothetical protein
MVGRAGERRIGQAEREAGERVLANHLLRTRWHRSSLHARPLAPSFVISVDYSAMKTRGVLFDGEPKTMPYGTGVLLQDLYGNKLYLNEDASSHESV